ncbi:MAG: helix-hairpin-helix domain-containing protein [bacterium]
MKRRIIRITMLVLIGVLVLSFMDTAIAQKKGKGKTLDLNIATVEELAKIPGLNKELAQAIVNYREKTGDIQALTELLKIKGFNRALLRKMQPYINLDSVGGDCSC